MPFRSKNDLEDKRPNRKRARDSNVDIDYIPEDKKQGKSDKFKGGEYIDYEEIN